MRKEKPKLSRPCRECGNKFKPTGRYNRVCEECTKDIYPYEGGRIKNDWKGIKKKA